MTDCDPELKKELDRISAEIDLEDELAHASHEFEVMQLFDKAKSHGEAYEQGYVDGFYAASELALKWREARDESIREKHAELRKRWGLDDF